LDSPMPSEFPSQARNRSRRLGSCSVPYPTCRCGIVGHPYICQPTPEVDKLVCKYRRAMNSGGKSHSARRTRTQCEVSMREAG
jgi:hypothetical protein